MNRHVRHEGDRDVVKLDHLTFGRGENVGVSNSERGAMDVTVMPEEGEREGGDSVECESKSVAALPVGAEKQQGTGCISDRGAGGGTRW